jgi:hypothetical protein
LAELELGAGAEIDPATEGVEEVDEAEEDDEVEAFDTAEDTDDGKRDMDAEFEELDVDTRSLKGKGSGLMMSWQAPPQGPPFPLRVTYWHLCPRGHLEESAHC